MRARERNDVIRLMICSWFNQSALNGAIFNWRYHQKPPLECPVMETKAIHGLAEPEAFTMPAQHQLWTPTVYDAFNLSKGVDVKDKSVRSRFSWAWFMNHSIEAFFVSCYIQGLRKEHSGCQRSPHTSRQRRSEDRQWLHCLIVDGQAVTYGSLL